MKQQWFKKAGWVYFPIHPMGYMVTLLAIIFMVPATLAALPNDIDSPFIRK